MIYVLGGRGLVGSAFVRLFEERGEECAIIDRQNYSEFIGKSCKLFINANGNSRKPLAAKAPVEEFDASVRSVRASLVDFRYDSYLHISSCDVYADCSRPVFTREDTPIHPAHQSTYGFHKWLGEQCVQHVASKWMILRLGGMVGPGLKKNAIFDILNGDKLWLDPESRLQFLYTADVARIALNLIANQCSGEIFNLCGRGTISLRTVIEAAGDRGISLQPGSPLVTYDVNISKIQTRVEIPETTHTVLQYVAAA